MSKIGQVAMVELFLYYAVLCYGAIVFLRVNESFLRTRQLSCVAIYFIVEFIKIIGSVRHETFHYKSTKLGLLYVTIQDKHIKQNIVLCFADVLK